jgi:hypothetical protein
MLMKPGLRIVVLAVHIVCSLGWVGALGAYLVLDLTVAYSQDATTLRAAYIAMGLITRWSIVPLAFATLATGLIMSLFTKWGLFRHYWTLISLVLTLFALAVLLIERLTVDYFAGIAADPNTSEATLQGLGSTLLHSIGGMVVLLVITWLNIYKPKGITPYGWRKQQEQLARGQP